VVLLFENFLISSLSKGKNMSFLNVSSREKLDMDLNESVSNHRNVFKSSETQIASTKTGFFIKTWVIFFLLLIAIACIVGVAIFVGFFNPFNSCACDNSTTIVPNCISHASMQNKILTNKSKIRSSSSPIPTDETEISPTYASSNKSYVRLPTSVIPEHYDVELQPYIGPLDFYFDGNVSIKDFLIMKRNP
jgi:hypothetical protein